MVGVTVWNVIVTKIYYKTYINLIGLTKYQFIRGDLSEINISSDNTTLSNSLYNEF